MDEAAKIGELVKQHPAVARYKDARRAVEEDAEASRMMAELDRQLESLARQAQAGMPPTDAQQQQVEALQNRLVSNLKVKALNLAQVEFVDLLRKISQTIQRPLADPPPAGAAAPGVAAPASAGGPRISGIAR
jgi:cell fate (sporulation/competence/biofilm development) regulator YlbF (YheA/YmcA/DUF963 family)